jgi:hypothetical protein
LDGKLFLHISSLMHTTSSFLILLMSWRCTWDLTLSSSSRHISLDLLHLLLIAILKQRYGSSIAYMQTLVRKDFHQLPKSHMGLHALSSRSLPWKEGMSRWRCVRSHEGLPTRKGSPCSPRAYPTKEKLNHSW